MAGTTEARKLTAAKAAYCEINAHTLPGTPQDWDKNALARAIGHASFLTLAEENYAANTGTPRCLCKAIRPLPEAATLTPEEFDSLQERRADAVCGGRA